MNKQATPSQRASRPHLRRGRRIPTLAALALVVVGVIGVLAFNTQPARGDSPAALDFDGTNDYVSFGAAPGLGAAQFTLEAWVRRDTTGIQTSTGAGGLTGTNEAIPILTKGRGEADGSNVDMNYFLGLHETTGSLVADFETATGLNHPAIKGRWTPAAATSARFLNSAPTTTPLGSP